MRLFVGTFVDNSLFENVYGNIKEDFKPTCYGKWVEKENLHFTVQFLGEADEDKLKDIIDIAGDDFRQYDSALEIKDLSAFPRLSAPNVLYAEVYNRDNQIFAAQKLIQDKMERLGFEPERRKFVPHITLVRIKDYDSEKFRQAYEKNKSIYIGKMESFKISLVMSELSSKGPVYTILK